MRNLLNYPCLFHNITYFNKLDGYRVGKTLKVIILIRHKRKKKCFALFFPFAFLEEAHPPSNAIGFTIFSEKHCCLSSPLGGLTLSGNEALLSELCSAPGCPQESSPGLSSWLEESVACSQEPGQSGKSRLQLNRRE